MFRGSKSRRVSLGTATAVGLTTALTAALLPFCAAFSANPPTDGEAAASPEHVEFFEKHVRPILAERCLECHGPDVQESGLRLDSRAAILAGGDRGTPAATPGQPAESLLVKAVRRDGDLQMPPDGPLDEKQVEAIRRWVELSLPWPADSTAPLESRSWAERVEEARQTHWAFSPVTRPALPQLRDDAWPRTGVDAYVLAGLEQAGLTPSPEADRRTLIRRLSFDLLGLPPTMEEIEAFEADMRPDAYQRLVDRLLASPRYGERWGRHWLDVARYADTKGYAFNRERRYPYAYTYRDYVIRAFNRDLPYDQFVLEQLAADLLPERDDNRSLAALGFLTVGRKFNNRHDDLDDQIDVVSRGLLGLTVACARCHDHKYDAIPTEDYYSLYGVFASSSEPDDLPVIGNPEEVPGYAAFKEELDKRQAQLDLFRSEKRDEIVTHARRHVLDYVVRAVARAEDADLKELTFLQVKQQDVRRRLVQGWTQYLLGQAKAEHPVWGPLFLMVQLPDDNFAEQVGPLLDTLQERADGAGEGQLNPLVRRALTESRPASKIDAARVYGQLLADVSRRSGGDADALADVKLDDPAYQQLLSILLADDSPTSIRVEDVDAYFNRADRERAAELQRNIDAWQVESPGAPPRAMVLREAQRPVDPVVFVRGNHARRGDAVPRQFVALVEGSDRTPFPRGSGRLDLAEAIVAADNPLTARVLVNRVWMYHFGEALVTTPSDFGIRCDSPTQLDLLNYLAWSVQQSGWSIKQLHRELVLSATYRQASLDRPDCRKIDPENQLWWRATRKRLEWEPLRDALLAVSGRLDATMGGRSVDATDPGSQRRTVYSFIDRQDLPGVFRVFDIANPDQSSPRRPNTTVPQQALFLMNSPFVIQQAQAVAARAEIRSAADDASRIEYLFRRILGRTPSAAEREAAAAFLVEAAEQRQESDKLSPIEQLAQLLLCSNEFCFVD